MPMPLIIWSIKILGCLHPASLLLLICAYAYMCYSYTNQLIIHYIIHNIEICGDLLDTKTNSSDSKYDGCKVSTMYIL